MNQRPQPLQKTGTLCPKIPHEVVPPWLKSMHGTPWAIRAEHLKDCSTEGEVHWMRESKYDEDE